MTSTRLKGWRKVASALWDAPGDPQIYGALELDAAPALAFIEHARAQGHHVTVTHLIGRAVAHALVAVPDLNVRLVGGRAVARESVDVFFITAVETGRDLTGVKIVAVDRKSVVEVGEELAERSRRMKEGHDPDFARAKRAMDWLPRPILRRVLRAAVWIAGDHDQSLPALGVPASPFGSAMVSSVGMLGLPMGFSPLAWIYRVPLLVLVGEISEKPVAVSGRVEVRLVLPISASIDHRYVDGAHIAKAMKAFREYMANPASFERLGGAEKVTPLRLVLDSKQAVRDATDRLLDDAATGLDALRRLRDELGLHIHLASSEAKTEWERLEARWRVLESHHVADLVAELREGYRRMRTALFTAARAR